MTTPNYWIDRKPLWALLGQDGRRAGACGRTFLYDFRSDALSDQAEGEKLIRVRVKYERVEKRRRGER